MGYTNQLWNKDGLNEAFIIEENVKNDLINQSPKSAEIIRPILKGRNIKKYCIDSSDKWIIVADFGSYRFLEKEYHSVYEHLKKFEKKLRERGQCRYSSSGKTSIDRDYPGQHHWLELDNNPSKQYLSLFEK